MDKPKKLTTSFLKKSMCSVILLLLLMPATVKAQEIRLNFQNTPLITVIN
jgi:hypothetical protein